MATIHLQGEINLDMLAVFSAEFGAIEQNTIEICSQGGEHMPSMAIQSMISTSHQKHITIARSACYSAAVIIFAAGHQRIASYETVFMVHDGREKHKGTPGDFQRALDRMEQDEAMWAKLMEAYTGTPMSVWRQMSRDTTYFSAARAMELGLVHEIIGEPKT